MEGKNSKKEESLRDESYPDTEEVVENFAADLLWKTMRLTTRKRRQQFVRYSRNPPNERPARWTHMYFWLIFQKSEITMFLSKIFPIQLYIGFLEKSVKNKYASIWWVAYWAGYGNNAQSVKSYWKNS